MPLLYLMALASAIALFAASLKRVPEGQAYTLRRVGGQMRTLGSGMHFVLPLVERVAHKIRLLGNVVDVGEIAMPGRTSLRGQIYYQVLDAARADTIVDALPEYLRETLPALAASAPPDPAARDLHLKAELNHSLRERGVLVARVQTH